MNIQQLRQRSDYVTARRTGVNRSWVLVTSSGTVFDVRCDHETATTTTRAKAVQLMRTVAFCKICAPPDVAVSGNRGSAVFIDQGGHTRLQLERTTHGTVIYVANDPDRRRGYRVYREAAAMFDRRFNELLDYLPVKAAQTYLHYAPLFHRSNSPKALRLLTQLVQGENQMETPNAVNPPTTSKETIVKTSKKKTASATTTRKHTTTKPSAKTTKGTPKKTTPEGFSDTPAGYIQQLIMDGNLTDDQIFIKAQARYKLDDKKRSYVAWYRNYLKKQGRTVPAVKE